MHSGLALFEQFAGKSPRGLSRFGLPRKFVFGLMFFGRLRILAYTAEVDESSVEAFHRLYHADARNMRVSCVDFVVHGGLFVFADES